jgi:hypothetical protein
LLLELKNGFDVTRLPPVSNHRYCPTRIFNHHTLAAGMVSELTFYFTTKPDFSPKMPDFSPNFFLCFKV